jgi:CelD/BcsL family acetyltransferase involved in cellulose biosynthesis
VGWPLTDFQGPIAGPGQPCAPRDLVAAGIRELRFDHFVPPGPQFDGFIMARHESPYVESAGGLDRYLRRDPRIGEESLDDASRRVANAEKSLRRRYAKAVRELGPLRFTADSTDHQLLDWLVTAKRAQYRRTGVRDVLAPAGARALLTRLLDTREPDFSAMLCAVHAGEALLAAKLSLRSGPVLHTWFSVYDRDHRNLGPSFILLREVMRAATELGIDRIDFGRGEEPYKQQLKTGGSYVCDAYLTRSSARLAALRLRHGAVRAARTAAIRAGLRPVVATLWRGWHKLSASHPAGPAAR